MQAGKESGCSNGLVDTSLKESTILEQRICNIYWFQ